jgi:hypothetical protein
MPRRYVMRGCRLLLRLLRPAFLLVLAVGLRAGAAALAHERRLPASSDVGSYGGLVVGVPGEDLTGTDEGSVNVLYGSSGGLTVTLGASFDQSMAGVPGSAEDEDHFGESLATGDLNGDGYDDLAIGVPYEDLGGTDRGSVNVLYGSSGGLTVTLSASFDQSTIDGSGSAENDDQFGYSLAAGDLNGDGCDDLAIGVPGEDLTGKDEGAVNVLYGSSDGLTVTLSASFDQSMAGVPGSAENGDQFGESLAMGDFDGDGYDDLAIGVPWEDLTLTGIDEGSVNVLYGSSDGLTVTLSTSFDQSMAGVPDSAEKDDYFGFSLATGDLNGDGYDDLVIGVPYEDLSGRDEGAVSVLYGSSGGLTVTLSTSFDQSMAGVPGFAEDFDYFGFSLATGDLNGDGYDDLAIGVPGEDLTGKDEGSVVVLYGSSDGLTTTLSTSFDQSMAGVPGSAEDEDRFGSPLAAGNLNGDGYDDLVVGVPYEDLSGRDEGSVNVLYGSSDGLTVTLSTSFDQSMAGVPDSAENDDCFGFSLATLAVPRHTVYLPLVLRQYP